METTRRTRGRPRKDERNAEQFVVSPGGAGNEIDGVGSTPGGDSGGDDGQQFVNLAAIGGDGSSGGPSGDTLPARRGRKPGSGRKKGAAAPVSISGLEQILLSSHMMLATALKNELWAITQPEAEMLARSFAEVSKHYDYLDGVSDKAIAWIGLGNAVAVVYGTRIMAARNMKKKEPPENNQAVL